MILARVVLGRHVLKSTKSRNSERMLPKAKFNGQEAYPTSLLADVPQKFTEYIIYDGECAYPEFIVKYKRV